MRNARSNVLADALAAPPSIGCHPTLLLPLFLLPGDRSRRPFPRPGICMRALPPNGETSPMAEPAVAAQIHEPLDVYGDFPAPVTLDGVVPVNHLADADDLSLAQFVDAPFWWNSHPFADIARA